jgi:hypothetical protein
MYLLAIRPPGNVEAEISLIQNKVYQEYSCPSALALPPLIPVSYQKELPGEDKLDLIVGTYPGEVGTEGLKLYDGCLYLECSDSQTFENISAACEEILKDTASAEPGILPVYPGFFICCLENPLETVPSSDFGELIPETRPPDRNHFKSYSFICIKISTTERRRWWVNISWEILYSKKIRYQR